MKDEDRAVISHDAWQQLPPEGETEQSCNYCMQESQVLCWSCLRKLQHLRASLQLTALHPGDLRRLRHILGQTAQDLAIQEPRLMSGLKASWGRSDKHRNCKAASRHAGENLGRSLEGVQHNQPTMRS